MDMNSTVPNEPREGRIQSVLRELGFTDRNFQEESTWFGLNQGYVFDVTTLDLNDELEEWKCEMMLKGQKPTLLMGGSKC